MSEIVSEPTILVPVDASEPGHPPEALVDLLHPHRIVVLGYYPVPDQTGIDQARDQFGDEVTETIDSIADRFAKRGGDVEAIVMFTRSRSDTIDNVAADYGADAILTTGLMGESLERILVPLRGEDNIERILGFLGGLVRESHASATLFNVATSDEEATHGELLIRGACDRLEEEEGIDPARVDWRQERASSVSGAITEAAEEYDILVVGESKPSLTERILGNVTNEVIEQSTDPLLIVRER